MSMAVPAALKSVVKRHLPRGLNVGPAVVQLFLNDRRTTRLGLVNFPSFLAPTRGIEYRYALRAFDESGREAGRMVVDLARYGSAEVDLRAVFGGKLPNCGMLAARIHPLNFFSLRDRHLGRIRPHFFTLYASEGMESIGLVHPQTNLGAAAEPARRWVSNLEVDVSLVERLELFQINPGRAAVHSEAFLQSSDGTVLARSASHIPPRGTRRVEFELARVAEHHKVVSVGLQGLPAANGKPILFLHFPDGSFTCCHG
jgi:hypothetical protein